MPNHRVHLFVIVAAVAGPASAATAQTAPAEPTKFEGALGLVTNYGPEYAGAASNGLRLVPAGFLRYGRWTLSGSGGFTTRSHTDVERGLAASLVERNRLRLGLSLRLDSGRRESSSDRLAGIGSVERTVRGRLQMRWRPDDDWTLSTGLSVDLLGRHGGWWADAGVSREWRLAAETRLQVGASLSMAGDTYFQRWYGVTPEQSQRSGFPVYTPGEGLHDVNLGATLRTEFGPRWSGFVSTGLSRQLGPAAASPLTERATGWSVGSGLAWRF